jgi:hypothetical protein
MLDLPMPFGAFQPPKPAVGGPTTVSLGRDQELLASAMAGGYIQLSASVAEKAGTAWVSQASPGSFDFAPSISLFAIDLRSASLRMTALYGV